MRVNKTKLNDQLLTCKYSVDGGLYTVRKRTTRYSSSSRTSTIETYVLGIDKDNRYTNIISGKHLDLILEVFRAAK